MTTISEQWLSELLNESDDRLSVAAFDGIVAEIDRLESLARQRREEVEATEAALGEARELLHSARFFLRGSPETAERIDAFLTRASKEPQP